MSREIGSEFWTGCTPSRKCSDNWALMRPALYLDFIHCITETLSGRTAIDHIAEHLLYHGKKSIYMPSYCCHTMIEPFICHGIDIMFYDVVIGESGLKRLIDYETDCDTIFLIDYFGHIDKETAEIAKAFNGKTLIYDATHSMYSDIDMKPYHYVCGSYRKWVDINCGFIAKRDGFHEGLMTQHRWINDSYTTVRNALFDLKADYIEGVNDVTKDDFYSKIGYAEELLEQDYQHKMADDRSIERLYHTDIYFLKSRRQENAKFLTNEINGLKSDIIRCLNPTLDDSEVPLFVPVLVDEGKRNDLRQFLISKDIYCPVHWPISNFHRLTSETKKMYDRELSIVCDQRYDINDMTRILEAIEVFIKQQ